MALQEIYDLVADEGWDVVKSPQGQFRLTPPDRSATVLGPSAPSDHRAIAVMVDDLRRAGLDVDERQSDSTPMVANSGPVAPAIASTDGLIDQPPGRRDRRRPTIADAHDERAKRRQEAGIPMSSVAESDPGETTAQRIARLEHELAEARQEAARQDSVGAAQAVAEWFRSGTEPSNDDWVAVISAAPDDALRAAGMVRRGAARSSGSGAGEGVGGGGRSTGHRAPRLSLEEVTATLPTVAFTVADLAAALDREVQTTRNYISRLLEAGAIVVAGEDSSGSGRAAKLYSRA